MSLQTERNLFEACIGLGVEAREEWLASHCPDPAMRERVLRLLRAHDSAEARGTLQTPPARPPEPQIGPYRLLERIGEGAMGDVYLAEQSTPVLRRVAIKVIKPGMDSREVIARFEVERQTLALMSHPCIAHIIDAGTTDAGRPYFAMEYVPGIPLTKYCDRHRLTIDERLALFLQICDAIQHAHQKGVIHRDLKPGNLLVTDLDGRPAPKVIDFGIAKAMSATNEPSRAHTRIGNLIGTPEYMSPEQAQLSPLDVDTRSDIYSLGVVLHELLTGLLPLETNRAPTSTPEQFVQELLSHTAQAPSTRIDSRDKKVQDAAAARRLTPRQLAHRLAGDLDWIVLKAMEKDRNRRYASPSELAADIRRHLSNEAVLAGPLSPVYRMRKFVSRHRVGIALVSCVFGAVVLFGAVMWLQAHEISLQRDEAQFQAQRAEASSEFMSVMLEEVGPPDQPLTPIQLLEKGVELLDRQYGGDPRFAAHMYLQISNRFADLGGAERRGQLLARAATIARDVGDDALVASIECTLARAESQENRLEQAGLHLQNGYDALARLNKPPHGARVDCLRAEAERADMSGKYAEALQFFEKARVELERANDIRGLPYHAVLTDIGGIYFKTGRIKDALILNARTSEMLDRNGRGGTMARSVAAGNRATLLFMLGETRRAEAAGADALRRVQALRRDQPAIPGIAIRYATTLNRLGRAEEAIRILTEARRQSEALGNRYWIGQASYQLAMSYVALGKPEVARTLMEEARLIWMDNPPANAEHLAELSRASADLALNAGDIAEARNLIDRSLEQFGYPANTSAPGCAAALITAARVYLASGENETALGFATAALRLTQGVARDVKESADVGEAQLVMAMAQKARGSRTEARLAIQRAVEALRNALGERHALTRAAINFQRSVAT
jgi:serine/threonine protein kinase/tetratricopeptide (TPR) repeat protein